MAELEKRLRVKTAPFHWHEEFAPFRVPDEPAWLVVHGASYHSTILLNGEQAATHAGIWDAFSIDLAPWRGKEARLEIASVANGGAEFPVPEVLSGFMPYVFSTWGGAFRPVEVVEAEADPVLPKPRPRCRVAVEGRRILVDGEPFYCRGALTWGWHPELGHPHLSPEASARDIRQARELGFNTLKFCLWMPPHAHLEAMAREGLMAWLELPLWAPKGDAAQLAQMERELLRIVGQYRHYDNVLAWTIGCELSDSTPPEWRRELVAKVKELTGHCLVKDNSGGAEMYGGDPREFGDFEDYHPYCDLPFFGPVLDSLLPGPRPSRPILLGETNDHDCIRDLAAMKADRPYWASSDPDVNPQGVRWQYDFPQVLDEFPRPALARHGLDGLLESSRGLSLFVRRAVFEMMRARQEIGGWVVTGWRDTPISTAGMIGEDDEPRFSARELASFNSPDCLFLAPLRRPPWVNGGNRPGWQDPLVQWQDRLALQFGLHSTRGAEGVLEWQLGGLAGRPMALSVEPLGSGCAERVFACDLSGELGAGDHLLCARHACGAENSWTLRLVPRPAGELSWKTAAPDLRVIEGESSLVLGVEGSGSLEGLPGVIAAPFWREAAYLFACHPVWAEEGWADAWRRFASVSGDAVLDPAWLDERCPGWDPLLMRIDARTYAEQPVAARWRGWVLTTLRPTGGLGSQPRGFASNPSGWELARLLAGLVR